MLVPEVSPYEKTWTFTTTPSGIRMAHAPLAHDDRFYLGIVFASGSRYETPENSGISHFLEHMMFRGSKLHPSFISLANAFEWLGGDWNAETGYEHTEFSFNGIYGTAKEAISLFAEFIKQPLLLDIEQERQVILREIEDEYNEFGHTTDLHCHMTRLFWPETPLSLPIIGTQKTVSRISLNDLKEHRQRFYLPNRMSLALVGGPKSNALLKNAIEAFSDYSFAAVQKPLSTPKSPKAKQGPLCQWVENSDNQYQIQISFLCLGEWSAQAPVYDLILRILVDGYGARLPLRLREELGLVYSVDARANLMHGCGTLDIEAAVTTDRIDEYMGAVMTVLHEFVEKGPSLEELNKAKHRAMIETDLIPSNPSSLGMRLAWSHIWDHSPNLSHAKRKLQDTTLQVVRKVSSQLFSAKNMGIIVMGPPCAGIEARLVKLATKQLQSPPAIKKKTTKKVTSKSQ